MHRRSCAAALLGLAILPVAPLHAADIPGNRNTTADARTGEVIAGRYEAKGDSDWYRLRLKGGQNYAFNYGSGNCSTVLTLRSPTGKILKSGSDKQAGSGFEFQPNKTAVYFLENRDGCTSLPIQDYPLEYYTVVAADARGDTKTAAKLDVGQSRQGQMNWQYDTDFYRTSLKAGRSYTITLDFHPNSEVALTDTKGKVLASARPTGDDLVVKLAGVKVQATGTYFLVARGLDAGGGYTLSLSTP
jgi:hypothetical protein